MLTPAELVWLIAAVAKGDEAAFERLYAATRAKLFGVVLRILRRQDLAEEVIQEGYVKIWKGRGRLKVFWGALGVWSRIGKSSYCWPTTMAGAASSWRPSSRRR